MRSGAAPPARPPTPRGRPCRVRPPRCRSRSRSCPRPAGRRAPRRRGARPSPPPAPRPAALWRPLASAPRSTGGASRAKGRSPRAKGRSPPHPRPARRRGGQLPPGSRTQGAGGPAGRSGFPEGPPAPVLAGVASVMPSERGKGRERGAAEEQLPKRRRSRRPRGGCGSGCETGVGSPTTEKEAAPGGAWLGPAVAVVRLFQWTQPNPTVTARCSVQKDTRRKQPVGSGHSLLGRIRVLFLSCCFDFDGDIVGIQILKY